MNSIYNINLEAFELLMSHNMLEQLIKAEIVDNIVKTVQFTEDDGISLINEIRKTENLNTEEEFLKWMEAHNLTPEKLVERSKKNFKFVKYILEKYKHKVGAVFLERKNNLDDYIYSIIRLRDPFHARELFIQIKEGEANFGDLASAFSEGQERMTRGVVGPTKLTNAHPTLAKTLQMSKVGEVQGPIQISDWNVLLRLETYSPAILNDQIRIMLSSELFNSHIQKEVDEEIVSLKKYFNK